MAGPRHLAERGAVVDWQRYTDGSKGHPLTLYWQGVLPDGRRATVARLSNPDGTFTRGGPWHWTIWERARVPAIEGNATSPQGGQAAVMRAFTRDDNRKLRT